ncbi:nucleoside diphosphate-linked moiety X motif 6-like isoform X1 [Argonauta hians]
MLRTGTCLAIRPSCSALSFITIFIKGFRGYISTRSTSLTYRYYCQHHLLRVSPILYSQSSLTYITTCPTPNMALEGKIDRFQGITILSDEISYDDEQDFEEKLAHSLKCWRDLIYRAAWIKVYSQHASIIPVCVKYGFDFHHAKPGYVMLNKWLKDDEPNMLPEYANQYIGVAGFVVNSKNELLVIKEAFSPFAKWKLPGGHADKEEDLPDTAIRETFEETGVKCTFESLLAFRHMHNYSFGCSDIYFICVLQPLTEEIQPCIQEVKDCRWMDLEEYANLEDISDTNRFFVKSYLQRLKHKKAIKPTEVLNYKKNGTNYIYSIQSIED